MTHVSNRIDAKFKALKALNRAAFITYIQGGDPTADISQDILMGLPKSGADIIELGMPFSDPAADGPAIDKAAQRALKAGATTRKTLEMVRKFRAQDNDTPIVLMGYFNPIYAYGLENFCRDAVSAGVDGLIIVDLPPEEDAELLAPANAHNIHVIRLATPTSDDARLPHILDGASGFLYYVAVAGVTGGKSATSTMISKAVERIRKHTDMPVAVGFGIRTKDQARMMAKRADAAVVGSAIVQKIADGITTLENGDHLYKDGLIEEVLDFVRELADGVRTART